MTYSISFYGFPWTDRVIKTRLFRWVMRGPVTASLTLGVTTVITRLGKQMNIDVAALQIVAMVAVIVVFEYSITLFARIWDRILFMGDDREELEQIRLLKDRLLTSNDIKQFFELILATLCDLLQVQGACLLVKNGNAPGIDIETGKISKQVFLGKDEIIEFVQNDYLQSNDLFLKMKENLSLLPIALVTEEEKQEFLGVIAVEDLELKRLDSNKIASIQKLILRTSQALYDRKIQENLFVSLEMLTPQVSIIQDLLATSRFDQQKIFDEHSIIDSSDLEKWVKDALDHMWGGPKLSQNPILQLKIVKDNANQKQETPVNALREILRTAIDKLRPEGERHYTNEWILFNLLDLKYLAGWKVKDIARKLSLSEADLYRKQRVAISAVSRQIVEMERSFIKEI